MTLDDYFPKETVVWAAETAQLVRELASGTFVPPVQGEGNKEKTITVSDHPFLDTDNKKKAAALFYALRFGYGFDQSIESNEWTPWPHQMKQANCFSQSVANYAVATALGLESRIVEYIGLEEEGANHLGGHSHLAINISDNEQAEWWTVDQSYSYYGPMKLEGQQLEINNLHKVYDLMNPPNQPNTDSKRFFSHLRSIVCNVEQAAKRITTLRENPHLVLTNGQRLGYPEIDQWQSSKAIKSAWFVQFSSALSDKEFGTLQSRAYLERPGVQSRALEYNISINSSGNVTDRILKGYFTAGINWSALQSPRVVVELPMSSVPNCAMELRSIELAEREELHESLFLVGLEGNYHEGEQDHSELTALAQESYRRVRTQGQYIELVSAVEALYQKYFSDRKEVLRGNVVESQMKKLAADNVYFSNYLRLKKQQRRARSAESKGTAESITDWQRRVTESYRLSILETDQEISPEDDAFYSLSSSAQDAYPLFPARLLLKGDLVNSVSTASVTIIMGSRDQSILPSNTQRLFDSLRVEKSLVVVDADHNEIMSIAAAQDVIREI